MHALPMHAEAVVTHVSAADALQVEQEQVPCDSGMQCIRVLLQG